MLAAFDLLYKNIALYWLASTIPFAGRWREWQRLVLSRLHGRDVLELGCGPGWLLADMVAAGYRCRAIDVSPQMVAGARRTLARRGLRATDAEVVQGRAQSLPFADAAFDTVVSTFPAPYIHDPATLHEVARVLRPGGRLVIVEGADLLPRGPLLWLLTGFARLVYGSRATVETSQATDRTLWAYRLALGESGMTVAREIVSDPAWRAYLIMGERDQGRPFGL